MKALVTSRSPLRIGGEREYAVPPLTTPPLDLPLDAEALAGYASVALFVERATAVKSDFALTPENARAIAEICVHLDGLPLAIELAAARVKVLPPKAMLSRVENRLKLLSGGSRDLPERQQTMRAAISWGYNLLDERTRHLFATLSVFRGGFSLDRRGAAGRRLPAIARRSVLDGISSLIDKAFVRRDPASPRRGAAVRDAGDDPRVRAGMPGRAGARRRGAARARRAHGLDRGRGRARDRAPGSGRGQLPHRHRMGGADGRRGAGAAARRGAVVVVVRARPVRRGTARAGDDPGRAGRRERAGARQGADRRGRDWPSCSATTTTPSRCSSRASTWRARTAIR